MLKLHLLLLFSSFLATNSQTRSFNTVDIDSPQILTCESQGDQHFFQIPIQKKTIGLEVIFSITPSSPHDLILTWSPDNKQPQILNILMPFIVPKSGKFELRIICSEKGQIEVRLRLNSVVHQEKLMGIEADKPIDVKNQISSTVTQNHQSTKVFKDLFSSIMVIILAILFTIISIYFIYRIFMFVYHKFGNTLGIEESDSSFTDIENNSPEIQELDFRERKILDMIQRKLKQMQEELEGKPSKNLEKKNSDDEDSLSYMFNNEDKTAEKQDGITNDDYLCNICLEREKIIILKPCGHACCCVKCAQDILKTKLACPMCRGKIEDIGTTNSYLEMLLCFDSQKSLA